MFPESGLKSFFRHPGFAAAASVFLVPFLLLFLLPLFSCPALVRADSTVISNATYASGSEIVVNGTTYRVIVAYGNSTGAVFEVGDELIDFTLGECREFFNELVCYKSKSVTSGRFTVYDLDARVEARRSIVSSKAPAGGRINVNVTFNNSGRGRAEEVIYLETIPVGMEIEDLETCSSYENSIWWKGELSPGSHLVCRYTLRSDMNLSGLIYGNITYTTITGTYTKYPDDNEVGFYYPDWLSIDAAPLVLGSGEHVNVRLNASTNLTSNLTFKPLSIPLGNSFVLRESSYSNLNVIRNTIEMSRKIRSNRSYVLDVNLTALERGDVPLDILLSYSVDSSEAVDIRYRFIINVSLLPLEIAFDMAEAALEPGFSEHIEVYVLNRNQGLNITSYMVKADSDLPGFSARTSEISSDGSEAKVKVLDVYYTLPDVNSSGKGYINVTVSGSGAFSSNAFGQAVVPVAYRPAGKVAIFKGINLSMKDGNPSAVVKVFAKSTHSRNVSGLRIRESIPGFFYYKGNTSAAVELEPGAIREAYSFELSLPPGFDNHGISELVTAFDYFYLGKAFSGDEKLEVDTLRLYEHLSEAAGEEPSSSAGNISSQAGGAIHPEDTLVSGTPGDGERGSRILFVSFIVFDIIVASLLVLVIAKGFSFYSLKQWIGAAFLARKETRLISMNQEIASRIEAIADSERQLESRKKEVEALLARLNRDLARHDRSVPLKVRGLMEKSKGLEQEFVRLESGRRPIEEKMAELKSKEESLKSRQAEVLKKKAELDKAGAELQAKREKLASDIRQLKDSLVALHDKYLAMERSKDSEERSLAQAKKARLDAVMKRFELLKERGEWLEREKRIIEEEKKKAAIEGSIIRKILNTNSRAKPKPGEDASPDSAAGTENGGDEKKEDRPTSGSP